MFLVFLITQRTTLPNKALLFHSGEEKEFIKESTIPRALLGGIVKKNTHDHVPCQFIQIKSKHQIIYCFFLTTNMTLAITCTCFPNYVISLVKIVI
jgi:hypothetical protein